MNATGTSQLIAICGYNVSLVAALIIRGFAWLIGLRLVLLPAGERVDGGATSRRA